MTVQHQHEAEIREKLLALGYRNHNRIRIYGEEFDLTSDPIADDSGFAVDAVCCKTGETRKLRIPLSILRMITGDLAHPSAA